MPINSLLFDLDGTIIAPEEGIVNSLIYAFEQLGGTVPEREVLLEFIGPPLIDSFSERYAWSSQKTDQAIAYYRERFAEKGVHENHLYEGIREVLQGFKKQGYRLFLATSKPTIFAKQILDNFQLSSLFDGITGSNLDNTRGQKTEIIAYVLHHFNLTAAQAIMIGDRKYDMIGAANNQVIGVGVTYGHGDAAELIEAGAEAIIGDCKDLPSLIQQF